MARGSGVVEVVDRFRLPCLEDEAGFRAFGGSGLLGSHGISIGEKREKWVRIGKVFK